MSAYTRVSKYCTLTPNICRSWVWKSLHISLLAPRILKWLLDVWKFFFSCLKQYTSLCRRWRSSQRSSELMCPCTSTVRYSSCPYLKVQLKAASSSCRCTSVAISAHLENIWSTREMPYSTSITSVMGPWKLYRTVWLWPSWVCFTFSRYLIYCCLPC
jgi:hypothetical protein